MDACAKLCFLKTSVEVVGDTNTGVLLGLYRAMFGRASGFLPWHFLVSVYQGIHIHNI